VTTADFARDWKVTTGYRVLLKVAWVLVMMAITVAVLAAVDGVSAGWWAAAGLALLALIVGGLLPEPLPAEMITGGRNHVDCRRPRGPRR
jgi:hypothetical protein